MKSKLSSDMAKFQKAIINGTKKSLVTYSEAVVKQAKEISPVDTGLMRDNIYYVLNQNFLGTEFIVNTDYASFVENGTSKQRPQPFMYTSIIEMEELLQKDLQINISKELKKSGVDIK